MLPRLPRRTLPYLALLVSMTLSLSAAAAPAPKKGAAPPPEAPGEKDKPFQDWKKVTKDAEVSKGFFTVYKKRENLYLELAPDQLNKPVLGIFSFARGIGSNFILGGLPLNDRLLQFQRAGDHVLLIEQNTRFVSPSGTPIDKARDLSLGNSVLASLKIESINDSSKAVLVDFAPVLVSDITDLAEGMRFAFGNKSVRFDKERSTLGTMKMFPENFEVEALLTYSPNDRTGLDLPTVPDERYIPITVHYSFSKLPDVPMQPRLADERVGYFVTAIKDFGRDSAENFWVRYAEHWRLEKKDPSAALSEPVKPIVFYIDKTVPEAYRPYVKEGVEKWQKAFEAAGFKNAIVAKDPPDDPNWDPEDVRYSTIRWITSSEPSFGAIGPSRNDPRTGEILDSDILVEASIVQNFRNSYRRYSGPDALASQILPSLRTEGWPSFIPMERRCEMQAGIEDGGALLHEALLLDGSLPPGSPVPEDYIHQAIVEVTMHEVGHTLGLRHNFRSSTGTPYDKLNDVAWTRDHGVTASVMDYPTPNISRDRSKQGDYFTSVVGDYDVWAIRYGYTPSGATNIDDDYKFAEKIAEASLDHGHEYSTDEDTYPTDALDPRSNIFDLGDDPLKFAQERSAYIAGLWKSPKFEERILGHDGDYPVLRRAVDVLLLQYGTALGMAVKYVGGQFQYRLHRGQPNAQDPLQPVSATRQREALDFLARRAFAADAFNPSPALLNRLAQDRWSHWGIPSSFGSTPQRLDYDLNDKVFAIQDRLLAGLLQPRLLARLREAEGHSADPFRLSEYFDRLTRMMWGDVGASAAEAKALEGPSTRRDIQRSYVDRLAALMVSPPPGLPDDARALARLQLTRIDARAGRVLSAKAPVGDYTRAHLLETRARIKRALDAHRETDTSRPGAVAAPGGN